MPKIYDNIHHSLTQGLNETLALSHRTDFCVGYFNLRGWKEVAANIETLSGAIVAEGNTDMLRFCRLLVGMQKMPVDILRAYFSKGEDHRIDQAEAVKLKKRLAQEFKEQLTIGTPTEQDEKALQQLSRQMKDKKVVVKLHLRYTLHAKLYLAYSNDKRVPIVGFLGSSNLTLAGLSKQGELNIDVLEQDAAHKLAIWFEDRWKDRWCIDITQELIEIIDNSWATPQLIPPFHIYIKIAYHLSREARAGMSEYKLPKVFQRELLAFQQKAVLVAARHLNKRGGVVIGDVVGLGKTITATALAKLFEDDFLLETLIICPKNLVEMWEEYKEKYHLRAKVISSSKVQSILPDLRRYRIVIIDESHNLRNHLGSRYRAIKAYLDANDSKVILLSATPYNKTYLDLSNQLRLFLSDDKDLGISPEAYIQSIGGQVQFSVRHTDTFIRSIKAFEKSECADDWRELMRLYLVRRTRSFIKNNYAETDSSNQRKFLTFADGTKSYFPDRIPKRVEYHFDPNDPTDLYAKLYSTQVVDMVNALELPRYGLKLYLSDKPLIKPNPAETVIMQNLGRAGKRLMGFCRTNLFKRLESSGYSFLLSISRHILRNYVFIYAMQNRLPIPIGKNIVTNLEDYLEDEDTDGDGDDNTLSLVLAEDTYLHNAQKLYELFDSTYKHRFDWIRSEFFSDFTKTTKDKNGTETTTNVSLLQSLRHDAHKLLQILHIGKDWNPKEDRQLNALYELLAVKHSQEKVLVFTQFADTAHYLCEQLKRKGLTQLEYVTGQDESPTDFAHRFSPISNKLTQHKASPQEIRVLIATDVLSEGQNLQDAHIVLNYDLPWAIIRLIQRAGRVDRIGQKAEQILCYSFLPEDGLESIIRLRKRLTQRIEENANVVGSDETFFDGDPINLADLYNEKSGILDGEEEEDSEVDLASLAYQIWKNATDANPALHKLIPDLPNVMYSTQKNTQAPEKEGVIVYARTAEDNDVLAWIDAQGNMITQSQYTILKAVECTPNTPPHYKLPQHHELVRKGIDFITDDERNTSGSLGKKTGVKYRVYMRLERYCAEYENTLFITEQLKKAVDDIFKYPLKEYARETLHRQLKAGVSDEQLALLVVSLREEDKLAIVNEEDYIHREPHIICSMGLINDSF